MNVLGIDYSLNGTGLSIFNGTNIILKKVFTNTKKNYDNDKEHFILSPKFDSYEYKIDWVVDQIINCADNYDYVCMEDHIGSYYNWMDGYGIIKHYLRKRGIPYLMISPTMLKKYAGNGNADKTQMSYLLRHEYKIDLDYIGDAANNIVDASWLAIVGHTYNEQFINETSKKAKISKERMSILKKLHEKQVKGK